MPCQWLVASQTFNSVSVGAGAVLADSAHWLGNANKLELPNAISHVRKHAAEATSPGP